MVDGDGSTLLDKTCGSDPPSNISSLTDRYKTDSYKTSVPDQV